MAIEARTNLLFSFDKMALCDAVKSGKGAEAFAKGLFDYLRGHRYVVAEIGPFCRL